MEREIKFRGKRVDNKEWIEGHYYFNGRCHWIVNNDKFRNEHYEVIPETVGQFTELRDMKGTDVYEGDLFVPRYNEFRPMEVRYFKGKYNISAYMLDECEVIGNVHDGI